ncbi:cryptococcal mannosyltransferase 1-domain-containing protein [Pisolithus orientalis]|uniref:cryptococcal mannosyltransferase 1-domain-containing protein n=1 Tax=Pisolithus orientalis TaxID=936130 RepID=UPI00222466F0|nr:cryptococcal mannosyltransferase 1-domain-containing protein [Pisolithus orientalis]KAI6015057.1 cryptococcal mannosyltransferase 1-domain-containing protein [Pisolithus orientalis]
MHPQLTTALPRAITMTSYPYTRTVRVTKPRRSFACSIQSQKVLASEYPYGRLSRTRGAFNHCTEYLADVRNQAFDPLHELRDANNEFFDTIIFMNDILPCVDGVLKLIWQSRRNDAGITCAADYVYQ